MFPKALINFLLVLDFTFITQPTEPGVIACDAARQYVVWLGVYFHMPLSSSSLISLVAMVMKLTLLPIVEVIRWIMETHQPITDTVVDRCISIRPRDAHACTADAQRNMRETFVVVVFFPFIKQPLEKLVFFTSVKLRTPPPHSFLKAIIQLPPTSPICSKHISIYTLARSLLFK